MTNTWLYLLGLSLLIVGSLSTTESSQAKDFDDIIDTLEEAEGDDYVPTQTIDEIIVNAANSTQEFEFFYDEKNSLLKLEYDMVFTEKEWKERQGNSRRKRTAAIRVGRQGAYRWTNNRILYEYAPRTFTSYQTRQIQAAMSDWSKYTCLSFSQANRGNRVLFRNSGGCHSRVGMVGGAQVVGLAYNCRYRGVVTHELGHAIGLHHEQTRPDRDSYVTIVPQNIPSNVRFNFQRYTWADIMNLGIPYDYLSIMHYSGTAFSVNSGVTIRTKDGRYQNVIGRRQTLSFRDIKTVNLMYNCKKVTRGCTLTDAQCPGEGFVGKDCKCWCPGKPYVLCAATKGGKVKPKPKPKPTSKPRPTTKPVVKKGCYDMHRSCAYWAANSQCTRSANYMLTYCKKSCKACGGVKVVRNTCVDLSYRCPTWARNRYCRSYYYARYMKSNCPRSCGYCKSASQQEKPAADCVDMNYYCNYWAKYGQCKSNPSYMSAYCKKSCGLCGSTSSSQQTGGKTSCVDKNPLCTGWASTGECKKNPAYMLVNCKKSCNVVCDEQNSPQKKVTVAPCRDANTNCVYYTSQCGNFYMKLGCRKTCGYCTA